MKITKSQLHKIIKEEIKAVVVAEVADKYKNWSWEDDDEDEDATAMNELTTDLADIMARISDTDPGDTAQDALGDLGNIIGTLDNYYTLGKKEASDPYGEDRYEGEYDQADARDGWDVEDKRDPDGWDVGDH